MYQQQFRLEAMARDQRGDVPSSARRQPRCEKRHLFWSSYVCPEPVLAKRSFLYINGSKMPFFAGNGPVTQETFEEALWPRHVEYRTEALAAAVSTRAAANETADTAEHSRGKLHILDAEQPPERILSEALPIVDGWAVGVVAAGQHVASEEKMALVDREMESLASASTAAERIKRRRPRAAL